MDASMGNCTSAIQLRKKAQKLCLGFFPFRDEARMVIAVYGFTPLYIT